MIWGSLCANGRAGLFFLPTGRTMNGPRYYRSAERQVDCIPDCALRDTVMQDGAPTLYQR